jgi:hypothetical protein
MVLNNYIYCYCYYYYYYYYFILIFIIVIIYYLILFYLILFISGDTNTPSPNWSDDKARFDLLGDSILVPAYGYSLPIKKICRLAEIYRESGFNLSSFAREVLSIWSVSLDARSILVNENITSIKNAHISTNHTCCFFCNEIVNEQEKAGILSNKLSNLLGISKEVSNTSQLSPTKRKLINHSRNNSSINRKLPTTSNGIIKPINNSHYLERCKSNFITVFITFFITIYLILIFLLNIVGELISNKVKQTMQLERKFSLGKNNKIFQNYLINFNYF